MKLEPKTVLLLFGYILFNFYYIYVIVVYSKQFDKVDDEIKFHKALKKTTEYKNNDLDKKFLKFFSKINKYYLSDEKIEKMYFDFLQGKEVKHQIKSNERKYLYVLTCILLVINGLLCYNLLRSREINLYIKFILVLIQLFLIYKLYLIIKNLSNEEISVSVNLLKNTIFFVIISLVIFMMHLFNMFNSDKLKKVIKSSVNKPEVENKVNKSINKNNTTNKQNNVEKQNNIDKQNTNKSNNSINDIEKILENNEKFLNNVSKSLKK
jgi:hypothetical protein